MRDHINISDPDTIYNQRPIQPDAKSSIFNELSLAGPETDLLQLEKDEDFFNYLNWLGLAKRPGLIVLSSRHHYFYDIDDLKNIITVVNMVPMNSIYNLKQFLSMIFTLIPYNCYFIGCFRDNKKESILFSHESDCKYPEYLEHGILSRIPLINIINNFLDKKTNIYLSKKNVTFILENQGFKILDITRLNGLTYFCTRKLITPDN